MVHNTDNLRSANDTLNSLPFACIMFVFYYTLSSVTENGHVKYMMWWSPIKITGGHTELQCLPGQSLVGVNCYKT